MKDRLQRRPAPTRRVVMIVVATAVVSAAIGGVAGTFVRSPAQIAADAAPPPISELTAPVEEGSIADPLLLQGAVTLGSITDLTPMHAGVITALPLDVGKPFKAGVVLVEVNDRPVIYLQGAVPLLRDLRPGDVGEDVRRLQEALRPWLAGEPDGVWGTDTTSAVRALYAATGYTAPEGFTALQSELVFGPTASATVLSISSALGAVVEAPLIRASTSAPTVVAEVTDTTSQSLRIGQRVTVTGSSIGGAQEGAITSIGGLTVGEDGVSRAAVVIAPDVVLAPAAVGGKVEIAVVVDDEPSTGLLVPLSAVRSNASTGTFVTVKRDDQTRRIAVTVNETGGGQARITPVGGDLAVGEQVVVGVK